MFLRLLWFHLNRRDKQWSLRMLRLLRNSREYVELVSSHTRVPPEHEENIDFCAYSKSARTWMNKNGFLRMIRFYLSTRMG
jgi:hypothetical protein